jgi:hypothetical protein
LTICFAFIFWFVAAGFGQTTDPQAKQLKKFELRPSSRDYAPVRRGNAYQRIERSKKPTLKSQQLQSKNKNGIKGEQKGNKRKHVAPSIRKNRRIKK